MKAVALYKYLPIEHPESLLDLELPDPQPSGRDLLVAVRAISVNPVDTKVRAPKDKVERDPRVLGWDAAGVVVDVGPEVTLFRSGDEVFYAGSLLRQGSNAELQLVDERVVGHKPARVDFAEAAALPLTSLTAWELLFERLGAPRGEPKQPAGTILIIGAGGGVGSVAVQLARRLTGLTVIATASRPETDEWARQLGAHHVVDHSRPLPPQLLPPQAQERRALLGVDVHAHHLRYARRDRAASHPRRDRAPRRQPGHPHHHDRGLRRHQRRQPQACPCAPRERPGARQDGAERILTDCVAAYVNLNET